MKLKKSLYRFLKSALLFYQKLSSDLKNKVFTINPYDPCVAKKMVNGKYMTITWHVDDLKISLTESRKVTRMITWLESQYVKMRISRGKLHD